MKRFKEAPTDELMVNELQNKSKRRKLTDCPTTNLPWERF